jgi:hypothetical protein
MGVGAGTPGAAARAEVRWRGYTARQESQYVRLEMPVMVAGTRITVYPPVLLGSKGTKEGLLKSVAEELGAATQGSAATEEAGVTEDVGIAGASGGANGGAAVDWEGLGGEMALYSARIVRGGVEGPLVDQLMGQGRVGSDAGSYLVPVEGKQVEGGGREYEVKEPMPVYMRVKAPGAAEAGEYRFLMRIETPGRAVAGKDGKTEVSGGSVEEAALALEVSELALPTEPRVLGVMTTTAGKLEELFPAAFGTGNPGGGIAGAYLDRRNPNHKEAVGRLDELVKAARREGVALFVEDMGPSVRVDERGAVALDWDAYDSVMQPYMDGSAFGDRVPLAVWLAPVPPRRIRDSATQLYQYIDGCATHFADKGWVATAAFMHPALAEVVRGGGEAGGRSGQSVKEREERMKLRREVGEMMRLHMPREMLAVTTPDAGVPHGLLWTVDDEDARLPPAGAMGTESSVRVWPWMCVARGAGQGVKGFVWRDGVAGGGAAGARGAGGVEQSAPGGGSGWSGEAGAADGVAERRDE